MSNATTVYVDNSRAVHDPFALNSNQPQGNVAELSHQIDMDSWVITPGISLKADMIRRRLEQLEFAASFSWLMSPRFVDDRKAESSRDDRDDLAAQRAKSKAAIQLLRSWREGDEQEQRETWEYLKCALDEDRLSNRKLFP